MKYLYEVKMHAAKVFFARHYLNLGSVLIPHLAICSFQVGTEIGIPSLMTLGGGKWELKEMKIAFAQD